MRRKITAQQIADLAQTLKRPLGHVRSRKITFEYAGKDGSVGLLENVRFDVNPETNRPTRRLVLAKDNGKEQAFDKSAEFFLTAILVNGERAVFKDARRGLSNS